MSKRCPSCQAVLQDDGTAKYDGPAPPGEKKPDPAPPSATPSEPTPAVPGAPPAAPKPQGVLAEVERMLGGPL